MRSLSLAAWLILCWNLRAADAQAGDLVIQVDPEPQVASIAVVRRFNDDGTLARPVNPKAKFQLPFCDQVVKNATARFRNLSPGVYDAIVFLTDGSRLEGFHWPIFNEFEDPNDPAFQSEPPEDAVEFIRDHIAGTHYYENKVTPLAMAGDEQHVRILMQLLRDQKTSYDGQFGAPVATLRYEIWQFSNNYGGWVRDKHAKVLHRILDAKATVRTRTWVWDRKLGGFRVERGGRNVSVHYRIPPNLSALPGLHPY